MELHYIISCVACFLLFGVGGLYASRELRDDIIRFDENYMILWGQDHVFSLDQGRQIQLTMDRSSGSGFASKRNYSSGYFHMRMKLPGTNSAGVVSAFYLTSTGNDHDELDFEFLGNVEGKPIILRTNMFMRDIGGREQDLVLWFDPTFEFHSYTILWNFHHIVFYVDNIPIRVHKNMMSGGGEYPRKAMRVEASIWDGSSWATEHGAIKVNWNYSPFVAEYEGFVIDGCSPLSAVVTSDDACYSPEYWWNREEFWELDEEQRLVYENVRDNHLLYDYCTDRVRYHIPPLECFYSRD